MPETTPTKTPTKTPTTTPTRREIPARPFITPQKDPGIKETPPSVCLGKFDSRATGMELAKK